MAAKIPDERREAIKAEIVERLTKGTPLAEICRDEHMPNPQTIYDWMELDADFSRLIARAREAGYDQIAIDVLRISDDGLNDTYVDENGFRRTDTDVIARSKLRVDTRLKLLAKWDPKRYGDKLAIGGAADLPPVQSNVTVDAAEAYKLLLGKGGT